MELHVDVTCRQKEHIVVDDMLAPDDQQASLLGTIIDDRYEIVELIGAGGMGLVFKARHKLMDMPVAVKVLKRKYGDDARSRERFLREAKATSSLVHPHLARVLDFGILPESGQCYIVMDYLPGCSLASLVEKGGPLDCKRALSIFSQICSGLANAHAHGILHRDIKPSNVMIRQNEDGTDFATVLDFGSALTLDPHQTRQELTQSGEVFGSPPYMSPEQCSGHKLDTRSDIYSLGCLMYEVLTGSPAFMGENPLQTIFMHTQKDAPPFRSETQVPLQIQEAILRCLSRDAEKRFQSAAQLGKFFDQVLAAGEAATKKLSAAVPAKETKKSTATIVAAGLGCLAIIAGLSYGITSGITLKWAPETTKATAQPKATRQTAKAIAPTENVAMEAPNQNRINRLVDRARALEKADEFGQAEALILQAMDMQKNLNGTNSLDYAQRLNDLAICYRQEGNPTRAAEKDRQSAEICRQYAEPFHPLTEWVTFSLANDLAVAQQFSEADLIYKQDIGLASQTAGFPKLALADRYRYFADSKMMNHQYSDAVTLYQRAADQIGTTGQPGEQQTRALYLALEAQALMLSHCTNSAGVQADKALACIETYSRPDGTDSEKNLSEAKKVLEHVYRLLGDNASADRAAR